MSRNTSGGGAQHYFVDRRPGDWSFRSASVQLGADTPVLTTKIMILPYRPDGCMLGPGVRIDATSSRRGCAAETTPHVVLRTVVSETTLRPTGQ